MAFGLVLAAALLTGGPPETCSPALSVAQIAAADSVVADIGVVNGMSREAFVAAFGGIFEHSPWVADRAFAARPFASGRALHDAMMGAARAAPLSDRLALLNAHPELAGKEARARRMTTSSASEQGGAGLDRMSAAEFDRFDRLNAAYREKFGFPFIIAVRGRGLEEIVAAFERRLANAPAAEMAAAFDEIAAITRMRLERRLGAFE